MDTSNMIRTFSKRSLLLCLATTLLLGAGCRSRAVEKDLRLVDVNTGWYDVGVVDGQNKLVPSVSLRIENVSEEPISNVQMNAIFRRVNEEQIWGEHFGRAIDRAGLGPSATGKPVVFRSERGYTGTQARAQMLQNKEFVDAKVEIFGKHGSRTWVKLGEFPVERRLLTN
jgi:hypothetical protein